MAEARTLTAGPVDISVPPDAAMSRVIRLAASGIATMGDFTIDEIEDIKIAVSEVLIALIEHGDGGTVDVRLELDAAGFSVRGRTACRDLDLAHPDLALCRTVLQGVCSDHSIAVIDGMAEISAAVARS